MRSISFTVYPVVVMQTDEPQNNEAVYNVSIFVQKNMSGLLNKIDNKILMLVGCRVE